MKKVDYILNIRPSASNFHCHRKVETSFQNTELGFIPKDWKLATLGDLCEIKTGPFGSALHAEDYVLYGTPIITVEHLGGIHIDKSKPIPMVSDIDANRLRVYSLEEGDIVYSRVGSVDRNSLVHKTEKGWLFSGRLLRLRWKKDYFPLYLSYYLNTEKTRDRIKSVAVGQTMPSLNTQILSAFKVILPPMAEQQAIATALGNIDEVIASLDKKIEKKRLIKQGAMQQLLTGKTRLKGFNEHWVKKTIGEICNIKKGQSLQSRDFKHGNVPVVAGGKTFAGFHNMSNFDVDTITISASGAYAGYVWLHHEPIFASDCSVIESKQTYNLDYIYNFLKLKQEEIYKAQVGGAQPHVHPKDIEPLELSLPPIEEQNAIASVLSSMDNELEALERKRDKYQQVKQGMMQQLLTGKIRLI